MCSLLHVGDVQVVDKLAEARTFVFKHETGAENGYYEAEAN